MAEGRRQHDHLEANVGAINLGRVWRCPGGRGSIAGAAIGSPRVSGSSVSALVLSQVAAGKVVAAPQEWRPADGVDLWTVGFLPLWGVNSQGARRTVAWKAGKLEPGQVFNSADPLPMV